ncbi:hypothetical protein ACIPC1_12220 [Streptomyces sp. NPDC087263]|uniref:hypothetical protein n=1 Tax=Streptomyces sp. NPDC087263 TaxID=3365773 RepID=UPI003800526D
MPVPPDDKFDHECRILLGTARPRDAVAAGRHIDNHATAERIATSVQAHGVCVIIDESTRQPTTHQNISLWNHTPVGRAGLDQLRLGARSLAHRGHVAALSAAADPDN